MYPVDAKVAAVVAGAVTAFREAGATVDEIDLVMAGSPSCDAG
jgi:Asp-tRNA(Asn)/Glu-tRNA(Gln) amidotransferase A subunit family amidase